MSEINMQGLLEAQLDRLSLKLRKNLDMVDRREYITRAVELEQYSLEMASIYRERYKSIVREYRRLHAKEKT